MQNSYLGVCIDMLVKHFAQVLSSTHRQNMKQGIWKKIPHYKLKSLNILEYFILVWHNEVIWCQS